MKNKKGHASIKFILATFAIVFAGMSGIFLYSKITQASPFTFVQSSWIGGLTGNTAVHPTNQIGWTEYNEKTNVSAGANLALSTIAKTFTDDGTVVSPGAIAPIGGVFGNGTLTSTGISGTGVNASVGLLNGTGGVFDVGVGVFPYSSAYDITNNAVWITSAGNTVTKIDAVTGAIIGGPISTGGTLTRAIAYDVTNNAVWVANQDSHNVTKIDATTGAVIGSPIAVSNFPDAIAYDVTNNVVWVGNNSDGNITKINATTGVVIGSPIYVGISTSIAFDITNNAVWVAGGIFGTGSVTKIDAVTGAVIGSPVVLSGNPYAITFDITNNAVWVANKDDSTVTKINATTGEVIGAPIAVGTGASPRGIAYDATNNVIWVTNTGNNTITKINAATGVVIGAPIDMVSPIAISFDVTNKAVWIGNSGVHTFTKLNVGPFPTSGTFESAVVDFGEASQFTTLSYGKSVPANTTLTMDIRGSVDFVTWTAWTTGVANGGDISAMNGSQYIQYRANFSTTDTAVSSTLYDVNINSNYWTFVDDGTTSTMGGVAPFGGGFGSGTNSSTAVSGIGAGASVGLLSTPPYATSGTFTSAVIDLGAFSTFTTLDFASITPTNTTLTMDVQGSVDNITWSGWTTNVLNGGDISAFSGDRYFQYRANLATTDTAVTPTLESVTINYSQYKISGALVSSVYDTTSANNTFTKLAWGTTGLTASEFVEFQVRSSPDGYTWSNWCELGLAVCNGVGHFTEADNNINFGNLLTLGNNDRYFQYKVFFFSGGYLSPALTTVTMSYEIAPPIISGVTISGIGSTVATVTWHTDTLSNSYVNYSTSPSLASPTSSGNATLTTTHTVALSGLASSTHYYFEVLSTDGISQLTTNTNGGVYFSFVTADPSGSGGGVVNTPPSSPIPPTPPEPVVTISASPDSVAINGTSVITYTVASATRGCTKSGDWSGGTEGSGTDTVGPLPAGTYTYTLLCTGGQGRTGSGSVTVTSGVVPPPTPPEPIVTIEANPISVPINGTSVITFTTQNVTTGCTKSGDWSGSIEGGSGTYTTNSLPAGTYTYTLTCTGVQNRTGSGSVTVVSGVTPPPTPPRPVVTITASPSSVSVNGTSVITYTVANATRGCTKSGDWSGAIEGGSGTYTTNSLPAGTYTYTLMCTGGQNRTGSGSVTVTSGISGIGSGGAIETGGSVGGSGAGGGSSTGGSGSGVGGSSTSGSGVNGGSGNNTGNSEREGGTGTIGENPITQAIQTTVSNIFTPEVKQTITTTRKNITEFSDTPVGNATTTTVTALGAGGGSAIALASAGGAAASFADIPLLVLRLWSVLLVSLGLRKKRAPWGTVYDSVTKQPLDPVYVVLNDSTGKEIKTAITDLDGRFGFLVPPGSYQISTKKTNYQAPSAKLAGKTSDELYDNLYFGGEVILGTNAVITKNIPMDPLAFDWNEFAKRDKKLMMFYSKNTRIINIALNTLFYLGLVSVVVLFAAKPDKLNLAILIIYGVLLALHLLGFKPKTFGTITDSATKTPLSFAIVRVFRKGFPQEIFHRVADQYGHYYCLLAKGEYYITIDRKNPDESYTTVYTSGVIDAKKGIINENFTA